MIKQWSSSQSLYYNPKKYLFIRTLTHQNANDFFLLMKSAPLIFASCQHNS